MNACRMPSIRNNQPWRIEVFTENELDALPNFVAAGQSHAAGAQHFSQGMPGRPAVMMMSSAMLVCVFLKWLSVFRAQLVSISLLCGGWVIAF